MMTEPYDTKNNNTAELLNLAYQLKLHDSIVSQAYV